MRYSYGNGPQALAFVLYAGLAFLLGIPFFSDEDEKIIRLWEIYGSPTPDEEEPIFPLVFAAFMSLVLSMIYFSKWFSEFSSRSSTLRFCAVISVALVFNAMSNFSFLIVCGFLAAAFPAIWSWRNPSLNDKWL